MDTLERRLLLRGLRMDFETVYEFPSLEEPTLLGYLFLRLYRTSNWMDATIQKGNIG